MTAHLGPRNRRTRPRLLIEVVNRHKCTQHRHVRAHVFSLVFRLHGSLDTPMPRSHGKKLAPLGQLNHLKRVVD